ncbi:uncharacterized protein BX664DRAFT_270033 [Halteromyces radiatus]|uniref:uncharacterized protein n=1 Tax=Halteromyces radiatus TaxID=101107 RepID=UPI00221F3934|nr:uncharacterized protein BX664DRAFT_270033 [Halteromyces radiatus]KAI8078857.1 hypothetical protein BX664DRAFT_270033 [Halteromyces radiatus]
MIPTTKNERTRWPCHKHILSKHSKYFEAMFACEFEESGATIIFMPCGIFNNTTTLETILQFMYTNELCLEQTTEDMLLQLDQLEDLYAAADYLGMPQLCIDITNKLLALGHHCTCYCDACAYIVPFLYALAQPRATDPCMLKLTDAALTIMTSDPEKALGSFWTCPSMMDLLQGYTIDNPLTQSLLAHISKTSAIESLHGCYVASYRLLALIEEEEQEEQEESVLQASIKAARSKATLTIASHFDFYCSEYPTLLSCIDGIVYSSDFMEYLLLRTIHDQMTPENACTLYQGVVRHLMARHAVQHSSHLKKIFHGIKDEIVRYIFYHVKEIRAHEKFEKLDHFTHHMEILQTVAVGRRVKLISRPVLTIGTVAFVGHVTFADGIWVGVELDRRVGKSDGSVDGQRYFTTTPSRGEFVRLDQVALIEV